MNEENLASTPRGKRESRAIAR